MNDVNYELIGTRIREKREEVGCSQEQLAWDAELSNTYISLVETGKKKPSLGSLLKISNALGITLDELLSGNQLHNPTDYQTDIDELMNDCTLKSIYKNGHGSLNGLLFFLNATHAIALFAKSQHLNKIIH